MRFTILSVTAVGAVLCAPGGIVHAQSGSVAVGERIRVSTPSGNGHARITGRLAGMSGDSLMLQADGEAAPRGVAVSNISRIESSRGMLTNGKRWMGYGFLAGAAVGAATGAAIYRKPTEPECLPDDFLFCTGPHRAGRGFNAPTGALVGGLLGMAVGGVSGRFHRSERWKRRTLGIDGRITMLPVGQHESLTLSARF